LPLGRNHSSKKFPDEEQRLQISRVFLERTVQNLNEYEYEYVQGWTAELVCNLDEIGISDWEDRKAGKVVVSHRRPYPAMSGQTRHDTSRNISKGETYLGDCVCFRCWKTAHSSQYYIARFSLGPRAAQKVRCSVRTGTDLVMKSNAKPNINAEMFLDDVQTVFLPNRAELRRLDECAEEMVVLLMDNGPSHITCVVM
jgi:hypothetical protein